MRITQRCNRSSGATYKASPAFIRKASDKPERQVARAQLREHQQNLVHEQQDAKGRGPGHQHGAKPQAIAEQRAMRDVFMREKSSVDSLFLTRAGFIEFFVVFVKLMHGLTAVFPALILLFYPDRETAGDC